MDEPEQKIDYHTQITEALSEIIEEMKPHACASICNEPIIVRQAEVREQYNKYRCQVCNNLVPRFFDEIELIFDSVDWNTLFGPKHLSVNQAMAFINDTINEFQRMIKNAFESYKEECDKEWGLQEKISTAPPAERNLKRNPFIAGFNEFFEEEEAHRKQYLVENVASPSLLARSSRECSDKFWRLWTHIRRELGRRVPKVRSIITFYLR